MNIQAWDRLLVRRAQSGEHRAFNLLLDKYRHRLMRLSMRYTRNRADAEDAVQETFLRVYRGLKYFRGESAFYSWLHRVAINSAKTVLSVRSRDASVLTVKPVSVSEICEAAVARWDTPEKLALTEEIGHAVNAAIEALCEEQRNAILLREIEGLSYAQIASSMSCPVGTVRSRVFRAREAIDEQLRAVFDDGLGRAKPQLHGRCHQRD
jgi:RNA polymerase sigma-70 factor, ECF subfamily